MQPANSKQLREELKTNKPILFTLIHKFRYDKGKKYPVLSTRDDIVVIVDEAHRTQYKDLAENMRNGLPNAQYLLIHQINSGHSATEVIEFGHGK